MELPPSKKRTSQSEEKEPRRELLKSQSLQGGEKSRVVCVTPPGVGEKKGKPQGGHQKTHSSSKVYPSTRFRFKKTSNQKKKKKRTHPPQSWSPLHPSTSHVFEGVLRLPEENLESARKQTNLKKFLPKGKWVEGPGIFRAVKPKAPAPSL